MRICTKLLSRSNVQSKSLLFSFIGLLTSAFDPEALLILIKLSVLFWITELLWRAVVT